MIQGFESDSIYIYVCYCPGGGGRGSEPEISLTQFWIRVITYSHQMASSRKLQKTCNFATNWMINITQSPSHHLYTLACWMIKKIHMNAE